MAKTLTPEQREEYLRLYAEYRRRVNTAHEVLMKHGMDSLEFAEADTKTGEIWSKMREMQGLGGAHWMA